MRVTDADRRGENDWEAEAEWSARVRMPRRKRADRTAGCWKEREARELANCATVSRIAEMRERAAAGVGGAAGGWAPARPAERKSGGVRRAWPLARNSSGRGIWRGSSKS